MAAEYLAMHRAYQHRVEGEHDAHPEGFYQYFRNVDDTIGLMRQWRWTVDGELFETLSWPEYLHPTIGKWRTGSRYELHAISGMGDDPYSCGECAHPITEQEAHDYAKQLGVDLNAPKLIE